MSLFKKLFFLALLLCWHLPSFCWGFFGHQKINYYAVFLLPPQMMVLYKPHIDFLTDHAVDADKRRNLYKEEAPRHYIDIDYYEAYPYPALPHNWAEAVAKFTKDTLEANGIVPWWVQAMKASLTNAFKEKDQSRILKLSADIGHYIADAHVPLHANRNHNGQLTDQRGIHAFWESRIPELLAEKNWNFFIGKADYLKSPGEFIWKRVLESAAAADTVLKIEKLLSKRFAEDQRYAFEERNGKLIRQYSTAYTKAYDAALKGMVERRIRLAIYAVASFWYTAWVDAGQPDLSHLSNKNFTAQDLKEFESLNQLWRQGSIIGREEN